VIVVSHELESLPLLCEKTMWLDHGRTQMIGPTKEVIAAYMEQVNADAQQRRAA